MTAGGCGTLRNLSRKPAGNLAEAVSRNHAEPIFATIPGGKRKAAGKLALRVAEPHAEARGTSAERVPPYPYVLPHRHRRGAEHRQTGCLSPVPLPRARRAATVGETFAPGAAAQSAREEPSRATNSCYLEDFDVIVLSPDRAAFP